MSAEATRAAIQVEPVENKDDFARIFDITANCFGRQTQDGIWMAMNPGWDTPQGRSDGISRLADRWSATTKDRNGNPNTIFLKASVADPENPSAKHIAGVAIWCQLSKVDGYGDVPVTDFSKAMDLNTLYPGNLAEQRYLCQLDASLHRRRIENVNEIASSSSPALFVLDLCVVDPAFQRRGISSKLVQWGLDEAERRGGLESVLEASSMGRHVYLKLGFRQDGPEIEYEVDEEFRERSRPSNIFMRTGLVKS